MTTGETIILSLGGSLIVPGSGIDTQFLSKFSEFVRNEIAEKKRRFFIICGGGATARSYIDAGGAIFGKSITNEDKDWLGIHSTRLNAHLVRTLFRDIAYPRIFKHYDRDYDIADEPVVVCSGWKPGWSTDYCAVLVAEKFGARTVVNMSNIDMVYDKDPRKFKDAKPIQKTTWEYFETLVGSKWTPGLNAPFDPIATQKAKNLSLNVIILNGKNIKNLGHALDGKKFVGTVITPFTLDASFYDRDYYTGKKGIYSGSVIRYTLQPRMMYRALLIKFFFRPKRVLDIGCGLGYLVKYLRMLGVEAWGLEISDYAMQNALPEAKPYIKEGDIRQIPFKDDSFDLVTSFDLLERIHPEDIDQAVKESKRVTSKFIFHKIYTEENTLLKRLHGDDLSLVSVHTLSWWANIWKQHKLKISKRNWIRVPQSFDSAFLLEK
jgi:uridylate kinase